MPRYQVGASGLVTRSLQLSLLIVPEAKHGDMEPVNVLVSQGALRIHSPSYHALNKTEPGEGSTQVILRRVPAEQLLLRHLPVQLRYPSQATAAGGNSAGTDVPVPAKANPPIQVGVEVALADERQSPLPVPPPHAALGVEQEGAHVKGLDSLCRL